MRISNPLLWKFHVPTEPRWRTFDFTAVCVLIIYLAVCIPAYIFWVEPSLRGANEWRIGGDSSTYMGVAENSSDQPIQIGLAVNLAGPVLLAAWLKEAWIIALFNIVLFVFSLLMLREVRRCIVLLWILANLLTFPSLLTVNKEILSLFCAVLLWQWLITRRTLWIVAAIAASALVRWEQALVLVVFILMLQVENRRKAIIALIVLISIVAPFHRTFVEASEAFGGSSAATAALNMMEDHGMYFVVFPLRLLAVFISQIVQWWDLFDMKRLHDLTTGIFVLGDQIAMCAIFAYAWYKGLLKLSNDAVYFMVIYAVIFCAAPMNQPRYFFFCYGMTAFVIGHVLSSRNPVRARALEWT